MHCKEQRQDALTCQSFNMVSVLERIDQQLVGFKMHKLWTTFFQHGKGPQAALATLRACAPALSYFIMSFRDFNEFVLPYENPQNSLQIAINEHAKEDCTHYKLFIEDWERLGGNILLSAYDHLIPGLPLDDHQAVITETCSTMTSNNILSSSTKMLSFLWSDATNRHNRKLIYNCTRLVNTCGEDPAVRFSIIETIEETGLFVFSSTSLLAREIMASTNLELRYFGNYHLALETGHLVNQEQLIDNGEFKGMHCSCEGDEPFKNLFLTEFQYKQCSDAVDIVAHFFTEWLDGIYNMMIKCSRIHQ